MESLELINIQFAIPIVGVVLCVLLVFAFGFRSVGQPSFAAMGEVEIKKKKGKETKKSNKPKAANGNVAVEKLKGELERKSVVKKRVNENKSNKQLSVKKNLIEKPAKPIIEEQAATKEGEWQTCLSKKRSRKLREESVSNDTEKDQFSISPRKGKLNDMPKKNKEEKKTQNTKKNRPNKDSAENLNAPKPSMTKNSVKKEALKEVESNHSNKKTEEKLTISPPEIINQTKNISNENLHSKDSNDWQEAPRKSKRRTRREQ